MTLAYPFWLLLLLLIPVIWYLPDRWGQGAAVRFPSAGLLAGLQPTWWQRLAWLPRALRCVCLALLVVALARPQKPNEKTRVYAEGIAIDMVVDNSGSMQIEDFVLDGKLVTRLDAVKDVFARFVEGDDSLVGRPNDLIGLVTFANFPDVKCPLTLSHDVLVHEIAGLKTALPSDDGTNIGDAIAWTLEDMKQAKAKSKVIILLTDGVNEPAVAEGMPDPLDPLEAAQIAAGLGVKIYAIGAGSGEPMVRIRGRVVPNRIVDERLLRAMASATGGKYYRATDTDGLRQIYGEIDRLERTRSETVVYRDYRELFAPLAWAGLAALCCEQLLLATRLRRIP